MAKKTEQTESTELATMQESGVPCNTGMIIDVEELMADAGAGSQNVTSTDLSTPILNILQSNSPQCKKSDGKYIAEAEEGMIYNNVTQELYNGDNGIIVVPAYFEKVYIEWAPNRGGLVAIHPANTPLLETVQQTTNSDGKTINVLPNGNEFVETNQHYVLLLKEDGTFEPCVIAMASTGLRASRMWNTLIKRVMIKDKNNNLFNPASYYKMYRVTTTVRTKDKNSWYTWHVEPAGTVPNKMIYDAAKAFEKAVGSGTVRVKQEQSSESSIAGLDGDDSDDNEI